MKTSCSPKQTQSGTENDSLRPYPVSEKATETTHGSSFTSNSCCFQPNQVIMEIGDSLINRNRWNNRRAVISSLSKLLRMEPLKVDLEKVYWLTDIPYKKRVHLTFTSPTISLTLLRMRKFLASLRISARRVFAKDSYSPPYLLKWKQAFPPTNLAPSQTPANPVNFTQTPEKLPQVSCSSEQKNQKHSIAFQKEI